MAHARSNTQPQVLNLDQQTLRDKLAHYCRKKGYDAPIISELENKASGHCWGMSVVTIYAMWLQFQPQRLDAQGQPIPRDDLDWLNGVTHCLSGWDGDLASLDSQQTKEIERYFSLIEHYQNPVKYSSGFTQTGLERIFSDTQERKIAAEFAMAGIFSAEQWKKELVAEPTVAIPAITSSSNALSLGSLIKEDKLIFLVSTVVRLSSGVFDDSHGTALIKHQDIYYYYDPNNKKGIVPFKANAAGEKELINEIFMRNFKTLTQPSALSLQAYDFNATHEAYPDAATVLNALTVKSDNDQQQLAAICLAIKAHDIASLEFYLKNIQVDDYVNQGNRLLAYAVQHDAADIVVNLLKKHHANVNIANSLGVTALLVASYYGNEAIVQILLANGAEPNIKDNKGATPLRVAAKNGHLNLVTMLVEQHQVPITTDVLLAAVIKERIDVVKFLLTKGIFSESDELLSAAVKQGNGVLVRVLLEKLTCSHEQLKVLINNAVNVNDGVMSALLDYAQQQHFSIDVQALLNRTALYGSTNVAALLLSRGADINQPDTTGITALQSACYSDKDNKQHMMQFLIQHKADINADPKQDGKPPLAIALQKQHLHAFNVLLVHGVAVAEDLQKQVAAHASSENKSRLLYESYQAFIMLSDLSQQIKALAEEDFYPHQKSATRAFKAAVDAQWVKLKRSPAFAIPAHFLNKEWAAYAALKNLVFHLEKIKQTKQVAGIPNIKEMIDTVYTKIAGGQSCCAAYAAFNEQLSALVSKNKEKRGIFSRFKLHSEDRFVFVAALETAQKSAAETGHAALPTATVKMPSKIKPS